MRRDGTPVVQVQQDDKEVRLLVLAEGVREQTGRVLVTVQQGDVGGQGRAPEGLADGDPRENDDARSLE